MAIIIRMPSVLAGSEEAAIASWLVEPGQSIAVGDPLAEIETEKAVVEYNSEDAGIVGRVLLEPGESGEIGAPIAVLIAEGEGDAEIDALLGGGSGSAGGAGAADAAAGSATDAAAGSASDAAPATGPSGATPTPEPGADGTAPAIPEGDEAERDPDGATPVVEAASQVEAEKAAVPEVPGSATAGATGATGGSDSAAPGAASASTSASTEPGSRLFVSPIARKLAKEKGIDPASIAGTGPDGRIVRRDIENAAPAAQAAPAAAPATEAAAPAPTAPAPSAPAQPAAAAPASTSDASAEWDLVPHTGMRKAIARRLTESKATVPHFYLTTECRVDDLIALRKQVNETSGVRVSINDFVVKAVAAAFAEVPEANVTWSDEGMRVHRAVDIAVAVATEGGLVTPVVRGVDTKSLSAVSASIAELVGRAKEKKLKQHELEGGSFSVSNLGMYGTLEFSAILNPPQSGILAVGAATQQAVVVDGEIRVATVMRCTLSVDHRAVDGALAARWLAAFTSRIENPLGILL